MPDLHPSRALRILTLCYEWPPIGGGGGRAAKDLAEALAARGHQITVQTIRLKDLPRQELVNGVQTFRTLGFRSHPDRCSPIEMAGYIVSSAYPAWRHSRNLRPDLIHAHFAVPTGALALPIAKIMGIPYFITAHLGDVPGTIPEQTQTLFRWLNPFVRPIWINAAGLAAVSKFVGQMAENAYGRSPAIIPNGIQIRNRPAIPARINLTPRMIFVGRLNPQKNLNFLVSLLAKLQDLTWQLHIVGEGALRNELSRRFADQGLVSRVTFHGWLDRHLVDEQLEVADIFLMPSHVEGLSMAILEALKNGLAIVGSDIPSLQECVTNNANGFLLPLSDPTAWIHSLRKLLTEHDTLLRFRQESWRLAENFDLERVAAKYELFFFNTLATLHNRLRTLGPG